MEDIIDRLIVECDRKIARALKRLTDEDAKAAIAISVSEVTIVISKSLWILLAIIFAIVPAPPSV